MQVYTKDTLIGVLKALNFKPTTSANKTQLITTLKSIVCDEKIPKKECPEGKVINPKTGRCINAPKSKPKTQPKLKSKSPSPKPKSPSPKALEKAEKPSATTLKKWCKEFFDVLDEGNSGCLRYTTIYITLENILASSIPNYDERNTNKLEIVNVDVEGELESINISVQRNNKLVKHIEYYSYDEIVDTDKAIYDFMNTLIEMANKSTKVRILSTPHESACGAEDGTFGKEILRDVFGAFLNECCGISKNNIIIQEGDPETHKRKTIKWK